MKAHKTWNYSGRYLRLGLQVSPQALRAIEFLLRIDESMIRFVTIKEPSLAARHGSEQPREYARIDPLTVQARSTNVELDFIAQHLLVSLNLATTDEIKSLPTYQPVTPPFTQPDLDDELLAQKLQEGEQALTSGQALEPEDESTLYTPEELSAADTALNTPGVAAPSKTLLREERDRQMRESSEAFNAILSRTYYAEENSLRAEFAQFKRGKDHAAIQAELDSIIGRRNPETPVAEVEPETESASKPSESK